MNLLVDKREQEQPSKENNLDSSLSKDSHPKKKLKILPVIVAFVALIVIAGAIVIFTRFDVLRSPATKGSADSTFIESGTEEENAARRRSSEEELTDSESAPMDTGVSCAAFAGRVMQNVEAVLMPGQTVNSLFFDETSFSGEILTSSLEEAQTVYSKLAGWFTDGITLTSSQPRSGQTVLLSGTYQAATLEPDVSVSDADIESQLRDVASRVGTSITSLSIDQGSEKTTVFMRQNGSLQECQQFLVNFNQLPYGINVSKIIILPSQDTNYTFVLRFYF